MRLFISYTTRDKFVNLTTLSKVSDELSKHGSVYIDLIHNDSKDQQSRVIDELKNCDLFIFLRSDSIWLSEWAFLELNLARDLNKKIIEYNIKNELDFQMISSHIASILACSNSE